MKLSLKDRLNEENPKIKDIKQESKEPVYYKTSEEALKIDLLGIIDTLLADDEINNIFVNGAKNIRIEKKGKIKQINSNFKNETELEKIVNKYLKYKGCDVENEKYFKLNYKKGVNLSLTLPPLSDKITLNFKCFNNKFANLKTLEENRCLSKEAALFLEAISNLDINILILGFKKSLKTTLLASLIKVLSENTQTCVIDYLNEIEINKSNCAYFDFSILKDIKKQKEITNSLISSSFDKLFINGLINDNIEDILKIASNNKGIVINYDIENLNNSNTEIINKIYKAFDIIITCDKFKDRAGKITKILQTSKQDSAPQEIFYLNETQKLDSTGLIPEVYNKMKENNISFNQNIFDKDYKHTYSNDINEMLNSEKTINPEILKKFKKDFLNNETKEPSQNNENRDL